jgi:thymidylate kinase
LIAIEGLDAVGKGTQSKLLADHLKGNLYSFPRYDTPLGGHILRHLKGYTALMEKRSRDSSDMQIDGDDYYVKAPEDAMVFQCMMTADKYDAQIDIERDMSSNLDVVADRWKPSAYCYGIADGLSPEWLKRIQLGLIEADLYIWLTVSEEEALRRRPKLRDRYEKDREKMKLVRENYNELWSERWGAGHGNSWVVVAGEGTIEEVQERILKEVNRRRQDLRW